LPSASAVVVAMNRKASARLSGVLSAFEDTIKKNEETGGATASMSLAGRFARKGASQDLRQSIAKNREYAAKKKELEEANRPKITKPERTPWKSSNLALINSDLAHKIREAAADLEPAWGGIGIDVGLHVWRIEQFKVVPWPKEQHGQFHKGDSYIVLYTYRRGMAAALYFDVYIWIGSESSQDEYGTAAYKMVECDDYLGGRAAQHREVQGYESEKFQSYFDYELTYLEGGVDTGFTHVEKKTWRANLYKIKGTEKGLSMAQMELAKTSLNSGDSFILFVNPATVFVWHGIKANPDERSKANIVSEKMCTQGTSVTLEQGDDSGADAEGFWTILGTEGEIGPAEEGDELVQEFTPALFRITGDRQVLHVADAAKVHRGAASAVALHKLDRKLLDDDDVFLLDAGWEVYLWVGNGSDKDEKIAGLTKADEYLQGTPRTANLPLTIIKSGWETPDFLEFFD